MPSITTKIVNTYLQGLRLPLTAAERMMNQSTATAWPPALAFESFEAGAKKILGALLGEDELVGEGRLIQAKLSELAEAEHLEAVAQQKRQSADARLRQRRQAADEARVQVKSQTHEREEQLRQERAAAERAVSQQVDRRRQAVAQTRQVRAKSVTALEREAERTRIAEESAALAKRRQALAAKRRAQRLNTALATKKTQRKGA